MKINISQGLLIVIKKHAIYIAILIIFIAAGVYFIPSLYEEINQQKSDAEHQRNLAVTRKEELEALERRLRSKEENLERRSDTFSQRESALENRERLSLQKEAQINEKNEKIDLLLQEQRVKLEQVAGLTVEEAKNILIQSMEAEAKREAARAVFQSDGVSADQFHKTDPSAKKVEQNVE